MYKKSIFITILLILILICSPILTVYGANNNDSELPFVDVNSTSKYYNDIMFTYNYGIFVGSITSSGERYFNPEKNINRALMAAVLYRTAAVLGCEQGENTNEMNFNDIDNLKPYQLEAIKWCYNNGVMKGTSQDTFSPKKNITVEQFATTIYRFAKNCNYIDKTMSINIEDYEDYGKASKYARETIKWALNEGIIEAENNKINPRSEITREKVAHGIKVFLSNSGFRLPFIDVDNTSEYYEDIMFVDMNNLLKGSVTSNGERKFMPEKNLNRVSMAIVLYRMAGSPEVDVNKEQNLKFTDIKKLNTLQKKAIIWCFENRVMIGTSDKTFSPKSNLTVEQFATTLYRYAKNILHVDIEDREVSTNITYTRRVSKYARYTLAWVINEDIIEPVDNKINPKDSISREKIAHYIKTYIDKMNMEL